MTIKPSDGERRAITGYRAQYVLSASIIIQSLHRGDLEWIRIADPEAEQVDDLQIASPGRIDAFQVKWSQYAGSITFRELTRSSEKEKSLIHQLADGWKNLKASNPNRRVVVHLATNRIPSDTPLTIFKGKTKPQPSHFAAFLEQSWKKADINLNDSWRAVWQALQKASKLSNEEFVEFVKDCNFDFNLQPPVESADITPVYNLLISIVASPERIVELGHAELLSRLGWVHRYEFHNRHEFKAPQYLYKPIRNTVLELQDRLEKNAGGYLGVFGPPGSGKSTFLTQTLRTLPARLIRYYAYVPDAQDPSVLRGESINFFHDITLAIQRAGIGDRERPDTTDRIALMSLFHKQLKLLGKDYETTQTRTIILIDGLDHISREQHPERSLLTDLPALSAIPPGVYIVVGSQTKDLPQLPVSIQQAFSEDDRTISIGKLSPQDVFEIVRETLPDIEQKYYQEIYQIVDGHPLALIYLLNSLFQSGSPENYEDILRNSIPYQGNIDEQYFSHWKKIEHDLELSNFLGLLARIRGPIPVKWVALWAEQSLLKKLKDIFLQYFSRDSLDRWEFFHNSFRIFLEAKTADALPGLTSEQIDQKYHLQLAKQYEKSDDPWKWETLYHYYKAGDHKRVTDIAKYAWFRSQAEALRPIDAIETDVRLAIKSAGELLDAAALIRYTLIGASLQQRRNVLKNTQLPHLLVESERTDLAIDYARDGARLRLDSKAALSFCRFLYIANLKEEAVRIFELAEPLEYLSGRPISGEHDRPQDLHDLLSEWVESASLIHTPAETTKIVRRIQAEPTWNEEDKDILKASLNLQNWLLHIGALSCCEREDWEGWQIFYDALDQQRDSNTRYFTLLRTIEHLRSINRSEDAAALFVKLLDMAEPKSFGAGRNKISNLLSVAESACFLKIENSQVISKKLSDRISTVPLNDREISRDNTPNLLNLQFRYARLKFILDETLTPDHLLREAEAQTDFAEYDDDATKLARRQLALIAFTLAKLWANGHLNGTQDPPVYLNKIKWIIDLIESGWTSQSSTFRLEVEGAKATIAKYIVICAAKQGPDTLHAVQEVFSLRWENNPTDWWAGIQREIISSFMEQGSDHRWIKHHLERIETMMLHGLDVYSRVEECEKQAKAWIQLGEKARALSLLYQLVKSARGIYSEKDYQLGRWAHWLRKTNSVEPALSVVRVQNFLRQVFSVEDTASGVDDALLMTLQAIFDMSPHKAVEIYQKMLERKAISHEDGITSLLSAALESNTTPIWDIYWIIENLIFPFARSSSPTLIRKFIARANTTLGNQTAFELSQRIAQRINLDVLPNQRAGWVEGIYDGLNEIGINPTIIGIRLIDLEREIESNKSSLDHSLHLSTGEKLTLRDALSVISTVDNLRAFLEKESRQVNNYFEWHNLAINLIPKAPTGSEVFEICRLMENRIDTYSKESYLVKVYTSASERLYQLGQIDNAKQVVEKALSLTKPSGWLTYFDDGAKHEAIRQKLKVYGGEGRENLIKTYAQDLGERFLYPEQIITNVREVSEVLFEDIPYSIIWLDIEAYLDEIFAGSFVEAQPDMEIILESSTESFADDAHNALAELLMLYLDFPAYPISIKAIQACSKSILADSVSVKSALRNVLGKHEQIAKQGLLALEIVSLQNPNTVSFFREEVLALQKSPNFILRMMSTRILNNASGQSSYPLRVDRIAPAIYLLQLPEITVHKTEDSIHGNSAPVLLGDPALILRPLDIEARKIADVAGISERNVLYRAVELFRELEIHRTWLFNNSQLSPKDLSVFLEKINLMFSHNKPNISPAKNAIAHVAAELYDAGQLSVSDLAFLGFVFIDYDSALFLKDYGPRPDYIERMGGLEYLRDSYVSIPKEWEKSPESSLPLLKSRSNDGRIILGEWTHLKRLEDEWPVEERISLMRATSPYSIWNDRDPYQEEVPFANTIGVHALDYLKITEFPAKELVIAHDGHRYQMEGANWLGLNPRVGFEMGWQPIDDGFFRWKDHTNQVVAESIFWQDGNFDSFSRYDHVEVGYGWVVLITEKGYQGIRRRFGALARGGIIKRNLGWLGSTARTKYADSLEMS